MFILLVTGAEILRREKFGTKLGFDGGVVITVGIGAAATSASRRRAGGR